MEGIGNNQMLSVTNEGQRIKCPVYIMKKCLCIYMSVCLCVFEGGLTWYFPENSTTNPWKGLLLSSMTIKDASGGASGVKKASMDAAHC